MPSCAAIVRTRTGQRAPIASIDEALAYRFSPAEQAIADEFFTGAIITGPAQVADRLRELATATGADELMLSTLVPSLAAREASLARIATAMA